MGGNYTNSTVFWTITLSDLTVGSQSGVDVSFDLSITASTGDGVAARTNNDGIYYWSVDDGRNGGSEVYYINGFLAEQLTFSLSNFSSSWGTASLNSWEGMVIFNNSGGTFNTSTGVVTADPTDLTSVRSVDFSIQVVPEPATIGLVGLAGVVYVVRRRLRHG